MRYLLITLVFLAACTGSVVDVPNVPGDGVPNARGPSGPIEDWCQDGTDWSWLAEGEQTNLEVHGIQETGEYTGMCHISYELESMEGITEVDYYINKDRQTGFMVLSIPGGEVSTFRWSRDVAVPS